MKAVVMTRFGDPSVLELAELPTPTPGPGEVLLRIEAAGINRLDHRIREGRVNPDLAFPHVLGSDAVGVVEALGEGVRAPEVGARVIPMPGYPADPADPGADVLSASRSYAIRGLAENGAYAQYMTVPARWTAREDTGRVAVELATLPTPLVAAARALRGVGEVRAGRKVLIHAGASGTGAVMVQVAKALGAEVAITARTEARRAFARGLGADLAIDPSEDVVGLVRDWSGGGADVVVDTLGRDMLALSLEATRPLGVVVLMGNAPGLEAQLAAWSVFFPQKRIRGSLMGGLDDLAWGLEQVRRGRVRPALDRVFAMEDAAAAHRRLAEGAALGKLAFDVESAA